MKSFPSAIPAAVLAVLTCGAAPAYAQFSAPTGLAAAGEAVISSASSSVPDPAQALAGQALLDALRRGGYVIYMRHTGTDLAINEQGMKYTSDCKNQRPLSPQGRENAVRMRKDIRALGVPVNEVLASPYCRTMETAQLMFERVEPRSEVRQVQGADYLGLKRLLAAKTDPGGNRWIIGHGIPFEAIAGPPHLDQGEAAVVRPLGNKWVVLARLHPKDWAALAASPKTAP